MKKPFTKDAISTTTRKLTLARQTLRRLTPGELAGAAGGDDDAPPQYHLTLTCLTCPSQ